MTPSIGHAIGVPWRAPSVPRNVGARVHTWAMADAVVIDARRVVEHVVAALVAAASTARRIGEPLALPTVHMLCADLDDPYVGYVRCRAFDSRSDAAAALELLGALPAAVAATHVLLVWDVAHLRSVLDPGRPATVDGLAIVEATFTEHVAHLLPTGKRADEWEPARSWPNGRLPAPIEAALQRWRTLTEDEVVGTANTLERAGFRVRWAGRAGQGQAAG